MPVDFTNQPQVESFKRQAIGKGLDPLHLEEYVKSKTSNPNLNTKRYDFKNTTPESENLVNQMPNPNPITIPPAGGENQGSILGVNAPITQRFGNRSSVEKYSGGVNYGTDFGVPAGTKVAAPSGTWKVIEAFNGATVQGPNNKQGGVNRGYGNSILVQNTQTGEKMRFSHLMPRGVFVKPGQTISGGMVIGQTGATGNTAGKTGQHLDLEYYNQQGKLSDVLSSPYGGSIIRS